ncbi:hypothetical protein FKM82_002583 [Ascaphus truei]
MLQSRDVAKHPGFSRGTSWKCHLVLVTAPGGGDAFHVYGPKGWMLEATGREMLLNKTLDILIIINTMLAWLRSGRCKHIPCVRAERNMLLIRVNAFVLSANLSLLKWCLEIAFYRTSSVYP